MRRCYAVDSVAVSLRRLSDTGRVHGCGKLRHDAAMILPFAKKTASPPAAATNLSGWYSLRANKQSKHADLYLYGVIGGWRVNVNTFLDDLRAAGDINSITVYLNTIGGTFYDGLPIYNTLKQHKAHVTVKVMGYALSMGSVIMLAADDVQAAENAIIMIHGAQGGVWGDARQMRHEADVLETHESAIIPEYMRRMGKSEQEVKTLLENETWYNASQAKAAGLVNTITGRVDMDEVEEQLAEDSWEFAVNHFHNPPDSVADRFQAHLAEAQRKNRPWIERIINTVAGEPAPLIEPENLPKQDELEMTEQERKELAALNGEAVEQAVTRANQKLLEGMQLLLQKAPMAPAPSGQDDEGETSNQDNTGETSNLKSLQTEIQQLKAALEAEQKNVTAKDERITALEKELQDYKVPDPDKNTDGVPENTGPADDWSQYGY